MDLYDQTTFHKPEVGTYGDCYRACLCTILQVNPDEVPHPIGPTGGWSGAFMKYMREVLGVVPRNYKATHEDNSHPLLRDSRSGVEVPKLVVAVGNSPRGNWLHGVVWDRLQGAMVHDPHPSRDGLVLVEGFDYFCPIVARVADGS